MGKVKDVLGVCFEDEIICNKCAGEKDLLEIAERDGEMITRKDVEGEETVFHCEFCGEKIG